MTNSSIVVANSELDLTAMPPSGRLPCGIAGESSRRVSMRVVSAAIEQVTVDAVILVVDARGIRGSRQHAHFIRLVDDAAGQACRLMAGLDLAMCASMVLERRQQPQLPCDVVLIFSGQRSLADVLEAAFKVADSRCYKSVAVPIMDGSEAGSEDFISEFMSGVRNFVAGPHQLQSFSLVVGDDPLAFAPVVA